MNKLDPGHLYDEPLKVTREGEAVVILGPDAVAVSLTAAAARLSAALLLEAAEAAEQSSGPEPRVLPIDQ